MQFTLTRTGKDGTSKKCECSLFISSNHNFTVYFKETTPEILLNDRQHHSIRELRGVANTICVDKKEILLEKCFVNIGDKWHQDTLLFENLC